MITVSLKETNHLITEIKIVGHADFSQSGTDIVCAGVSSIVDGSVSFFLQDNYRQSINVRRTHGNVHFLVREVDNSNLQSSLRMLIHQLSNVAHFFSSYIVIKRV